MDKNVTVPSEEKVAQTNGQQETPAEHHMTPMQIIDMGAPVEPPTEEVKS